MPISVQEERILDRHTITREESIAASRSVEDAECEVDVATSLRCVVSARRMKVFISTSSHRRNIAPKAVFDAPQRMLPGIWRMRRVRLMQLPPCAAKCLHGG